jgi:hypothetical protein
MSLRRSMEAGLVAATLMFRSGDILLPYRKSLEPATRANLVADVKIT